MTKKKVTTTYRREYSPDRSASQPSVIRSFGANFNYREYRRQVEHGHHKSPFVWDDWEYELEGQFNHPTPSDTCCRKPSKRTQVVTQRSGSSSSGEPADDPDDSFVRPPRKNDQQCQTRLAAPEVRGRRQRRRSSSVHSDGDCNCGVEQGRRVRGQGQPARVLSDTISKSLKKVSKRSAQPDLGRPGSAPMDDAPFAQYGMGDDEEETGYKRTHNVLSHQGVYPTAAGAKLRQISAKELRSRQPVREVNSKTTLHDLEFNNRRNKQTSAWQSEYNKNYRQYPTSRYY